MNEFISPVPMPALDATAPEVCRQIYGMPMFTKIPADDFEASKRFWIEALGFIDLFTIPGQLTHLRRWAFQDVLLVPGDGAPRATGTEVSFTCVLSQIDELVDRCEDLVPGCTSRSETPWNSTDLTIITPENTRVVMTAARPIVPGSVEEQNLRDIGWGTLES
ncbi:VOC family protein [Stackebrandtia soli]|uniref:VOC family protein n=1 Tax=Stackebrandtia soli TaxID=1892856 RepID=UPI0039E99063